MKEYSCSNCRIISCKHLDRQYPEFCPTKNLTDDEISGITGLDEEKTAVTGNMMRNPIL